MSQTTIYQMAISGPKTAASYSGELNDLLEAFLTKHSGSSAPATPYTYQDWMDESGGTTSVPWKVFDGTDWITIGTLVTTSNIFQIALPDNYVTTAKLEDIGLGYIIIGNASGQTVKLAPGTEGQVLVIGSSGVPEYQTPTVYATVAEAIVFSVALG